MKSKDFANFAFDVAEMLSHNDSSACGAAWQQLAPIFEIKPTAKVADVCRLFISAKRDGVADGNVSIIVDGLPSLMKLLAPRAKKDLLGDLHTLSAALADVHNCSLHDLAGCVSASLSQQVGKKAKAASAPNVEAIEKYVSALENSFRDAGAFNAVFSALKSDASVKLNELKSIAKQFSGVSAKSKVQALNGIWRLHEEIMIDRAKAAATGGRTAA